MIYRYLLCLIKVVSYPFVARFFYPAEDGIRGLVLSRGRGFVYGNAVGEFQWGNAVGEFQWGNAVGEFQWGNAVGEFQWGNAVGEFQWGNACPLYTYDEADAQRGVDIVVRQTLPQ